MLEAGYRVNAEIYEGVLDTIRGVVQADEIDPTADVFEIGATSLMVMQIITLVNDRYGVDVNITDLFEADDVATFAAVAASR